MDDQQTVGTSNFLLWRESFDQKTQLQNKHNNQTYHVWSEESHCYLWFPKKRIQYQLVFEQSSENICILLNKILLKKRKFHDFSGFRNSSKKEYWNRDRSCTIKHCWVQSLQYLWSKEGLQVSPKAFINSICQWTCSKDHQIWWTCNWISDLLFRNARPTQKLVGFVSTTSLDSESVQIRFLASLGQLLNLFWSHPTFFFLWPNLTRSLICTEHETNLLFT